MRNLKRALSLTLASVMLLGMMVVGAGAASYPDVDDADNIEAIEVLQAVQVMRGDEYGNFRPDDSVSRVEMAVVMALLLDLDYEYYEASCPFTDVPAWARGYVGACYANGIVSGYSANTYGASDGVTAVQAASMMMRALGYFKYDSDYADGFELSTVRQGTRIGIFSGVGSNAADKAMTRNQVAQMALNALESTMVDARKTSADITVGSGDTAVNISGQVEYIVRTGATNDKMATAIKTTTANGYGTDGTNGPTIELGEQLYNGDLKKATSTDAFGAPATRWTYKNTEIGKYADEADATYTTEVKLKDIHKDLGLSGEIAKDEVAFIIDGVDDSTASQVYANDGETDLNDVKLISADSGNGALKLGGNGILVKAYKGTKNDSGTIKDTATICVINTYALQVDGEYNDKKEELQLKDLDGVKELPNQTSTKLSSEDFDGLEYFNDGDYVLVTVANKEIQTIKAAETFTDTVTAYVAKRGDANSNSVTAGGSTYKYNKNYTAKTYEVKEQYVLVLDDYGYVIFTDGVDIDDQYVYVSTAKGQGGVKGNMEADAYFEDGTDEVIIVTADSASGFSWNADSSNSVHSWFTYEKKSGKYELTAFENVGTGATAKKSLAITDTNDAKVYYDTGKYLLANVDTKFIVLRGDTVTVYNGIREVPEISSKSGGTGAYINAVMDGSYAKYVFIEAAKNDVEIKGGIDAHIYIYDEEPTVTTNEDGDKVYTYSVIKDGELTTIDMSGKTYASGSDWALGLYGDPTTDSNGYIDTADRIVNDTASSELKAYKVDGPKVEITGDVLAIGGLTLVLDRDYTIWVSDGDDTGKLTKNQFNRDYDESFKGVIYVALDDGRVTEIYVEEDEDVFDAVTESKAAKVWQQPESEEEVADRLADGVTNGFLASDTSGAAGLVSLDSVKQYITVDEGTGVPTIHLYGTLDADKVFTASTDDSAVVKMLNIWYNGQDDKGDPKANTYNSVAAAITGIYSAETKAIGAVVYSYDGYTQIQLVKAGANNQAMNSANQTSIPKDLNVSVAGNECILDISGLKFPAGSVPTT